ncbi:MAG TPA: GTPase Era [Kiritimatiellia bacterium]|jgi:GTP-binding protein Era|nr:GTPase Era [Kiritimatiellia bacterium]HOR98002.1 GTPase Era [Kiritimatiellia bacterium]HPC48903.1 GTPase Era [Kiritimatiellia bacterium]HPK37254.1 GTPase Era [Kiritimatiellia bacterium]HPW76212.1 GTPase Era [Kiritimatiellia bacterium]
MSPSAPHGSKRCAVVGIVGRTNSGKSTLLNRMVGEKVSIVSPVMQTTRSTIRGILTEDRGQLVFLDTPGLHKSEGTLGTLMNRMARQASAGVDLLLVVFDGGNRPHLEDDGWMRRVLFAEHPVVFVLNKSDRSPFYETAFKAQWETVQTEKQMRREVVWVTTSAIHPAGAVDLVDRIFALATPSDHYLFPEDVVTDYPRKLTIADVIREKFLVRLYEEVPHELGVKVENIDEQPHGWTVSVTIYVNRPSQKGLVIGPKGRTLKYVRQCAEPELSDLFGVKVVLDLWVKVEKDWMKNFWLLRQMGYAGTH